MARPGAVGTLAHMKPLFQRRPGPAWSAPCSIWRGCLCIRSATAQTAPVLNRTVRLEANGESRRASVRKSSFPGSHCDHILHLTQRSRTWATSFTSSARSSSSSHSCRSSGSASPSKRTPDGTPGHGTAARTGDRRGFHVGRCAGVAAARHCRDGLEIELRVLPQERAMTRELSGPLPCEPEAPKGDVGQRGRFAA